MSTGGAGWYGNWNGKHRWYDGEDNNDPALPGATNNKPGIATPASGRLGGWYRVRAPNGIWAVVRRTDTGPAGWTGRYLDINACAAETLFGYSPSTFPDRGWEWHYLGRSHGRWRPGVQNGSGGGSSSPYRKRPFRTVRKYKQIPAITRLGPYEGVYAPDYSIVIYKQGDPKKKLSPGEVNLRSVRSIQTSKSLADIAGTFQIVLKDSRALVRVHEMDVVRILLKGHDDTKARTVMIGVVDGVRQPGQADIQAASMDAIIEGRCLAKYLQSTSLFLPVWDPQALLPTALIFGAGDPTSKAGVEGNSVEGSRPEQTPRDIFNYLLAHYTFGKRKEVGVGGIPAARYWLNATRRFDTMEGFALPFIQFDEEEVSAALKRLEILGFSEAWVDEFGSIVYRHPQWDAPARFDISTSSLTQWSFGRSDVDTKTYVEVIPSGDPGLSTATAQALRAGRAPIPSSYLAGMASGSQTNPDTSGAGNPQSRDGTTLADYVTEEFVIETDDSGNVTGKGKANKWFQLQQRLGVRPENVTSPLLFTQEQAQAQAEGLLIFHSRFQKTAQIALPGEPKVRLGVNCRLHGEVDGRRINRTYYIAGVQHQYTEGEGYTTSLQLEHGRDPWDRKWGEIAIPRFDPNLLSVLPAVADGGNTDSNFVPASYNVNQEGFQAILELAKLARDQYGLTVHEFGPGIGKSWAQYGFPDIVDDVHVSNSRHYQGVAFDASGNASAMSNFANAIKNNNGLEVYWCGKNPVNVYNGSPTSCGGGTGGHTNHVHVGWVAGDPGLPAT